MKTKITDTEILPVMSVSCSKEDHDIAFHFSTDLNT
jgi:hypothetical protein